MILMATSSFVEDGFERLFAALEPQIRLEVETEYTERLTNASWFLRWRLRRELEREIERRVRSQASPLSLF